MSNKSNHRSSKVSVVVLAFNRFTETTGRCLASLSEDPDFPSWEVHVIDNGSRQDERKILLDSQLLYPHMRVVLLQENLGFPGGMNVGLRESTGDPIFLIGSDTVVPPGTIGRLTATLRDHPEGGLISPVTNAAGNEQRIFIEGGLPLSGQLQQGREFVEASAFGSVAAYRLDFCCVGLQRKVYEKIGGLDEAFGLGYYEDFDYSLRARAEGFEILVAETAFVYHEGSASFGAAKERQKALIRHNKALLLKKHGRTTLLPHVRDANLSVLEQYARMIEGGRAPPTLRIVNRLKLAEADLPRGPLKRWRYLRRLGALRQQLVPHLQMSLREMRR
jgi:GT2 family glycosyltransferase